MTSSTSTRSRTAGATRSWRNGRRHAPDTFDLAELQSRLTGAEWLDDAGFRAHGLDAASVASLRRWAQAWADDIAERLVEGGAPEE
ncbi:hypothetical protein TPAU25S_00940 [Tsukamurella paurometabola]